MQREEVVGSLKRLLAYCRSRVVRCADIELKHRKRAESATSPGTKLSMLESSKHNGELAKGWAVSAQAVHEAIKLIAR